MMENLNELLEHLQSIDSSDYEEQNEQTNEWINSSMVSVMPMVDSDITKHSLSIDESLYSFPIFLLSQFNVHYMPWIKNSTYNVDYLERFACITEKVFQLPEFTNSNVPLTESLRDSIVERSINYSKQFRRQLIISFKGLTGVKNPKMFRVALQRDKDKSNDFVEQSSIQNDKNNLNDLDESVEGEEESESESEIKSNNEMLTEDEGDSSVSSPDTKGLNDDELNQTSIVKVKNDSSSMRQQKTNRSEDQVFNDYYLLGNIKLIPNVAYIVTFPVESNHLESDIYIKLSLIDMDDVTEREYIKLFISESVITGFSGYRKRFSLKLNDDSSDQSIMEQIDFELYLSWQVDSECYQSLNEKPIDIVKKLPGAMFILGEYYWHFYKGFYRYSLLQNENPILRYSALQVFNEINLMLSPTQLYETMVPLYHEMYSLNYPLKCDLNHLMDEEYLPEPYSLMDNSSTLAYCFSKEQQIDLIRRLLPSACNLLFNRFRSTRRLIRLLRYHLSNYIIDDLEQVILPYAIELLRHLPLIQDPENELNGPNDRLITWNDINSLTMQILMLIIECIQCSRAQNWSSLPIDHDDMVGTGRLLEQTIHSLFNVQTIVFLKAIYIRMREKQVLNDNHLAPFLTSDRIKQYRTWYSSSNDPPIDIAN
ncbi:hypothetical protein BLOT_013138 [Blomia tropicalis]|nr:hypothetical protein BLOT_013138 [Blomia tropicalis]